MSKKYKLNEQLLDTKSGITKLEKDGFSRTEIVDYMYKETPGLNASQRRKIISNLYDRKE